MFLRNLKLLMIRSIAITHKLQILTLTTTLFFSLAYGNFAQAKAHESLDRIAAIVNDSIITQNELRDATSTIKKQMSQSSAPIPTDELLHKQVLDQLINRKLQIQIAEQTGLNLKDEEVESAIKHIAETNKISLPELYEKITSQGMTKAEYRKEIHDEMLIQKVQQQEFGGKIKVTPNEIDSYLKSKSWQAFNNKEYHLEEIMVHLPASPNPQELSDGKQRADAIVMAIITGKNFRDAVAVDANVDNAVQGGDLGWRKMQEIPGPIAEQLTHTSVGGIIGPLLTSNGFVVIHVADARNSKLDIAEQRAEIQQLLFQKKSEEAVKNWMAKLRNSAFIEVKDSTLKEKKKLT